MKIMNLRKQIVLVGLLLSSLLLTTPTDAQVQPVVITMWHIATDSDPFRPVLQGAIDTFNATHRNVQFEAQAIQNEVFRDQLQAAVITRQQPDVFQTWGGGLLKSYVDTGIVREIPELVGQAFVPNALAPSTFNGKHYAVPANLAGVFLWYNQDLFNQHNVHLPITWEDLLVACQSFQNIGILPVAVGNRDRWTGGLWLTYLTERIGGSDTLNETILAQAGERLQDMVRAGCFGDNANSTSFGEAQTLLANGSAAMQLQGDWNLGGLRSVNRELTNASIRVLPFPTLDGQFDNSIVGGTGQAFAISHDAPPETASALIELLSSSTFGRSVAGSGFIPALSGYEADIVDPLVREMASRLQGASHVELYLDQLLPPAAAIVHLQTIQQLFDGTILPTQAAASVWAVASQLQTINAQGVLSLKQLGQQHGIQIGTAVLADPLRSQPQYAETIKHEFNMLTPETAMKMSILRPSRETFDFTDADFIVNFAQTNGMQVRGHPLVWHNQLPQWLEQGNYTRDELIQILRDHVKTVVSRYRGRVGTWDVVNEAINEDGTLRENIWLRIIGPEYIEYAFQWAHEADPNAALFYNDYDSEGLNVKSDAIYGLVSRLKANGVPLQGVGLQMHLSVNEPPTVEAVKTNIERLGTLGLEVQITELDVQTWDSNFSLPDKLREQAKIYGDMASVCVTFKFCTALITWGFTDQYTWIEDPSGNRDMTLPFDKLYQPKSAYFALVSALDGLG